MKKFKFRLEPLLKVKSHLEKQRQKDHAEALEKVHSQKDRLATIDANRQIVTDDQRSRMTGRLFVNQLLSGTRYLLKLKKDTLAGLELLHGMEREAEDKRLALVQAARERKMYEKLRERQEEKYIEEINLQERKDLDEVAVNNYRIQNRP